MRGYIALISVLVVGAVATAIAVSILLLGLNFSRSGFSLESSQTAKAYANACAESALQQIRNTSAYTGSGGLSFVYGTCTYTVTNTGGNTRKIIVSGTVGTVVRRVQISISAINPLIVVSSWQEQGDFN